MRTFFVLVLCLLGALNVARGQAVAPKYSNEFMALGAGARGLGMGQTQVALAQDVTAGYWNPAGLVHMDSSYEVALMHAEWFGGVANYDYGAFGIRLDSMSALSVSVLRLGVDDIPDTRFLYDANGVLDYSQVRFFSAADYGFLLSYARRLKVPGLQVGGSLKVIHRVAGRFATAWGLGFDAGLQYQRGAWTWALAAKDITGTFNAWAHNPELLADVFVQTGNVLPQNSVEVTLPRLQPGVARRFKLAQQWVALVALEANITWDGQRNTLISTGLLSIDPQMGLEVGYAQKVFLRGGLGGYQELIEANGTGNQVFSLNAKF